MSTTDKMESHDEPVPSLLHFRMPQSTSRALKLRNCLRLFIPMVGAPPAKPMLLLGHMAQALESHSLVVFCTLLGLCPVMAPKKDVRNLGAVQEHGDTWRVEVPLGALLFESTES